jgi:hypothetical protein
MRKRTREEKRRNEREERNFEEQKLPSSSGGGKVGIENIILIAFLSAYGGFPVASSNAAIPNAHICCYLNKIIIYYFT